MHQLEIQQGNICIMFSCENTTVKRDSLCIQYNEVAHSGIVFPFAKGNLKVW